MQPRPPDDELPPGPAGQRIDRWLWFARLVKSRSLARALVEDGHVRRNRERLAKPAQTIQPGDIVAVLVHDRVRVLKVLAPGHRRGPATEARQLYEEVVPPSGT